MLVFGGYLRPVGVVSYIYNWALAIQSFHFQNHLELVFEVEISWSGICVWCLAEICAGEIPSHLWLRFRRSSRWFLLFVLRSLAIQLRPWLFSEASNSHLIVILLTLDLFFIFLPISLILPFTWPLLSSLRRIVLLTLPGLMIGSPWLNFAVFRICVFALGGSFPSIASSLPSYRMLRVLLIRTWLVSAATFISFPPILQRASLALLIKILLDFSEFKSVLVFLWILALGF